MNRPLHISVYFDFICPWCLIGKRNLSQALQLLARQQPQTPVELDWIGVQLLPDLPASGVPFAEFYLNRLGSTQAVRQRQAQVQAAAARAGLDIDLQRIPRMPNSADAHRLLVHASALGSAAQLDALLERLFAAYFMRGEDLGDSATLLQIAAECGYPAAQLANSLRGDGSPFYGPGAHSSGGVPTFVINQRLALSGAQPPEVLLGALLRAIEQAPQGSPA
ncbi:DsbA family oxidoreductase [Pseudomonas sp. N040]|uniref:DsbA family oxidoreductase n=1 Tax=Pseudomonas sp. N040 TaxID=2785325 RepID=UPI0018A31BD5|nr:DsbA family oxidoreductase [Pseudomonas sp. N040]MBF7729033.1 DsbA family oxidoreductase [Pseudomonas sp. N040]MBW7012673.1 DsbA family oxidoreductase [Pseudomonas sp. N040]